jgi:hypothetical protein
MAAPALPQPAFTALFNDIAKDPFNGTYSSLFAPFDISLMDANPTPNNVCQQIAAASNQNSPLAIALLVNGLIPVYCLPFWHNQAVGAASVPALDGKFFAFNGKLVLGQGVLVKIPAQWFNMTAQVQVPTLNNIRAWLPMPHSLSPWAPMLTGRPWSFPTSMSAYSWRSPMESLCVVTSTPYSPSWRPIVPWEHALPSPSTVKWPSPSPLGGSPPCRLFPLPHLHVMSPSSRNPTSFSATTFQPCWMPSHPLMISSRWVRTSPLTKMSRLFVRTRLGRRKSRSSVPQ